MNPAYEKANWAKDFDIVVHDECTSGVTDASVINRILDPHRAGLPGVVLHCGMHCYRSEGYPKMTPWFEFTGLQSTGHGKQPPIEVSYVDKENPIAKGMANWTTINEELYNNSTGQLLDTARPLARGKQGMSDYVVTWTNTYNKKTSRLLHDAGSQQRHGRRRPLSRSGDTRTPLGDESPERRRQTGGRIRGEEVEVIHNKSREPVRERCSSHCSPYGLRFFSCFGWHDKHTSYNPRRFPTSACQQPDGQATLYPLLLGLVRV